MLKFLKFVKSFAQKWNLRLVEAEIIVEKFIPYPILYFLRPCWCVVWSYRPNLEENYPIWGNDWSHSPFIRRSPRWGWLGFYSALRQMPGDLCTLPRIISLSPLSLATDVTDATLGASGLWLGTRTGADGTATLTESFFWPQPMAPWELLPRNSRSILNYHLSYTN